MNYSFNSHKLETTLTTRSYIGGNGRLIYLGALHLMETGDVQKKDLMEHPENYILLTTLDEGEFSYIILS